MNKNRLLIGPQEHRLLQMALLEDGAFRDVTTLATVPASLCVRGYFIARPAGVLSGLPVVAEIFRLLDPRVRLKPRVKEGAAFRPDTVVAEVSGPARAILSGERVALNLLSHLSGISVLTKAFVKAAGRSCVYDTRKTTPLWRSFERYAVRCGGGCNHRLNLSSQVLVKDNHRAVDGVYAAVRASRMKWGRRAFIEAEVESELETREAMKAGADALLFDNRTPKELSKLLRLTKGASIVTEASGGITLQNVRAYAVTGVDRVSVGALTHSAMPVDFSLELEGLPKGKG
jgi:nicotinate-nucleotide pyrophosphorylase (carboxylating)